MPGATITGCTAPAAAWAPIDPKPKENEMKT